MQQIENQLLSIHQKLQNLLKQYQLLQKENTQLKKELEKNKAQLTTQENTQQATFKLNSNGKTDEEKVALEKRIDKYLAEIDKCLLLLNSSV